MSIIDVLSSKVKAVQTKIEHFIDGIPTIQRIVEETIKVEENKTQPRTIEIDGEYEINSQGRLALKHPACPIHGTSYITKNGWTRNTLELITGDKIKIIRQMHICNKCVTTILPSLECLKIPFGRITKDGQRYLLELTIEDGLSLRKAKRRLKNTFGLEISIDRLWYLIQTTGKKCEEFTEELDIKLSGVFCYDEDVLRKTVKNAYKMTILDAVTGYAFEEKVKENKQSDTIKNFLVEGLKDKKVDAIVTDCDPKYLPIIKTNFPDALHQLCVGHFNNIIDGDLRMAAGLKYGKKKELPDEFKKIKGKSYYVFSSKNRLIAEQRLYRVFQEEYGKNSEIDAILLKIKENFYNLTHFMGNRRIPKTNNFLESRYSTTESNYNNNRRFKSLDGANNYSNCQTVFRNFHKIEEGTYVGSSPASRTGFKQGDDDWLNIMEFGDKIFNYIKSFEKNVLSKLGVG
jgi:predicted transcriptional regulator YdeE